MNVRLVRKAVVRWGVLEIRAERRKERTTDAYLLEYGTSPFSTFTLIIFLCVNKKVERRIPNPTSLPATTLCTHLLTSLRRTNA